MPEHFFDRLRQPTHEPNRGQRGTDAGVPDATTVDASAAPLDAGVRDPSPRAEPLKAHLAAAEAARRAGNRLRQLAEADAALKAAPGNRQARFLIGDALVGSGDLPRGCKYLRQAGSAAAMARAREVGCP